MSSKKGTKKNDKESEGKKDKNEGKWTAGYKAILIVSLALWVFAGYYWFLYISNAAFGMAYGDALYFTTFTTDLALMWAMMFTFPAFILLVLACLHPSARGKKK
jgi:hypothetical protein